MPNINDPIIDFNDFNAEPQLLRDIQDGKAIAFYSFAHLLLDTSGKPYTLPTGLYISGAYDTLQQLQSAFPTGNTNLYIVNADKYIYYWNGSTWTKGGTIDATYAFGVELQVPNTATNGTLTQEQFNQLSSNENAYILFNNERYLLMDKGHEADTWGYSHLGADITGAKIKVITINTSNRSWVLTDEEFVKDGTISAQKIQDGAVTTQKLSSDVSLQIKKNDFASRFNSDRLNILEAQINSDKNTIEYTSDKPLEITCDGANIIDCNARFKKVEGQTRRYSPNIYKMPNNSYNDSSDRYSVKSETETGVFTLTTKTFTDIITVYFDTNWTPTIGTHTTIANFSDVQFYVEARKKVTGDIEWYIVNSKRVLTIENSDYNAVRLYVQLNNASENQNKTFIYKPMVLEGQYFFDELPPFQPYDNTLINSKATFVSTGRNLFSSETFDTPTLGYDAGTCTINMKQGAWTKYDLKKPFTLPKGVYTIIRSSNLSANTFLYEKNGSIATQIAFGEKTHPVSFGKDVEIVSIGTNGMSSDIKGSFKFAIVSGKITEYSDKYFEPYIESTSQYDIELGAYDYIENGNLIKQTSEMVTLNGSENWTYNTDFNGYRVFHYTIEGVEVKQFNGVTNSVEVPFAKSYGENGVHVAWDGNINKLWVRLFTKKFETADELKTWLKANPITLVYQKATPTITPIVVPNGIVSYKNGLTSQEIKGKYLPYKYTAKYVYGGQQ